MAGITGLGTTFNLPNFTGSLYGLSKEETPFLSAIGGLSAGGGAVADYEFEWQAYDLRQRGQNVALEGADAPTAQARVRTNYSNLVQVHHEAVEVSYTRQAAHQRLAGLNQGGMSNPVVSEESWQIEQALKQVAGDINWSFINGQYQKPVDNTTPRKTRGLLQAIPASNRAVQSGTVDRTASAGTSATDTITVTHSLAVGQRVVFTSVSGAAASVIVLGKVYYVQSISTTVSFKITDTNGGAAITVGNGTNIGFYEVTNTANTKAEVNLLARRVWENGGSAANLTTVLMVGNRQAEAISTGFGSQYAENSRTVAGISIDTVITDYGTFGVMRELDMPQDAIALVQLSACRPVWLDIPGKGHLFLEPLAKTGAKDKSQIYGEVGLDYGNGTFHGVTRGLFIPA
jgi:hypothetical protein